jgi:hypothetical protein
MVKHTILRNQHTTFTVSSSHLNTFKVILSMMRLLIHLINITRNSKAMELVNLLLL